MLCRGESEKDNSTVSSADKATDKDQEAGASPYQFSISVKAVKL